MPPRYAYWTIVAGGLPTAFRTSKREELLPTFHQIKQKHPDAEMRWFARGKLWASPEEAQEALAASRQVRGDQRSATGKGASGRGRDWRPGGEHRDPRQRFKDAKKARNQERRQERWERKSGERAAGPGERRAWAEKKPGERTSRPGERKPWAGKKPGPKPERKREKPVEERPARRGRRTPRAPKRSS